MILSLCAHLHSTTTRKGPFSAPFIMHYTRGGPSLPSPFPICFLGAGPRFRPNTFCFSSSFRKWREGPPPPLSFWRREGLSGLPKQVFPSSLPLSLSFPPLLPLLFGPLFPSEVAPLLPTRLPPLLLSSSSWQLSICQKSNAISFEIGVDLHGRVREAHFIQGAARSVRRIPPGTPRLHSDWDLSGSPPPPFAPFRPLPWRPTTEWIWAAGRSGKPKKSKRGSKKRKGGMKRENKRPYYYPGAISKRGKWERYRPPPTDRPGPFALFRESSFRFSVTVRLSAACR